MTVSLCAPRYTLLMGSLPPLGGLFEARTPAISLLKLESRLSLLHPDDRHTLELMTGFLSQSMRDDDSLAGPIDERLLESARQFFAAVSNPTLRQLVAHRLDLRTILAALRRRHRGESEPPTGQAWGFGPWVATIARRWSEPAFGLEAVFPWIPEVSGLLESGDLVALERTLFGVIWRDLDRLVFGHHFDFEAVVVYVARWALVDRWSHYDAEAAQARFTGLVEAALAHHDAACARPPAVPRR
ncbi:hypothetical protein CPCC7001_2240 [Cyanobium sp. PCC 7001]|uniref:DUF2764 family protein n=1 Tax=Cyanobium sp. PCC 7001 TaxID=180281 RepID=UPI0001804C15|nr:DUF2764 family protein [Cyanobium sp. PCC 7001]EDY39360.1 hypothetical protein CPCC7001_2240 [Cyanobium sp. PCC 7001]